MSLRPSWKGSGFQPPPAVASERHRSQSVGSSSGASGNIFAVLDEDDEDVAAAIASVDSNRARSDSTSSKGRSLADLAQQSKTAVRYTREKLLALRPAAAHKAPDSVKAHSTIRSPVAQDPVCFDSLNADEIWNQARRNKGGRNNASNNRQSDRWQRGVALPTESSKKETTDLWDDPLAPAGDLSTFGDSGAAFDFDAMAKASAQLEEELHGDKHVKATTGNNAHKVNPSRPLAAQGTTIVSGSGDDVNVFEDFDEEQANDAPLPVEKALTEPQEDASSKLMAMIGVQKALAEESPKKSEPAVAPSLAGWGDAPESDKVGLTGLNLNPWGGSSSLMASATPDLQAQLRQAELEKARVAEARRRQVEEERIRQQQKQQQDQVQSQVENVLIDRICGFLEKSWGRADLKTILAALHAEDPRVVPLLNSLDALRALILRNSKRVGLQKDPTNFGLEVAVLLIDNAQWQQKQRPQPSGSRAKPQTGAPWFYSDPQGNIQGPFRGEEMRQWLEAGYFKGNLPVSQSPQGPFAPLAQIFSDLSRAFVHSAGAAEEGARREAAEREAREKAVREATEREAREKATREQVVREQATREQVAREEAARKQAAREQAARDAERRAVVAATAQAQHQQQQNNDSAQLKMMLGLNVSTPAPAKLATPEKPAAPAWGGTKQSQPTRSMSEIQKEEARVAAVAAMNREKAGGGSSGWANVAAAKGGSSGWASGTAKMSPATVVPGKSTVPMQAPRPVAKAPSVAAQGKKVAPVPSKASAQRQQSSASSTAEEFGATMPPALEKWCKKQMMKLNGTDDLTLVSFCMSLKDPAEIRQYLTAYLGSTSQVNSFATEFINRKEGEASQPQQEWETTVSSKKKGKKKGGR